MCRPCRQCTSGCNKWAHEETRDVARIGLTYLRVERKPLHSAPVEVVLRDVQRSSETSFLYASFSHFRKCFPCAGRPTLARCCQICQSIATFDHDVGHIVPGDDQNGQMSSTPVTFGPNLATWVVMSIATSDQSSTRFGQAQFMLVNLGLVAANVGLTLPASAQSAKAHAERPRSSQRSPKQNKQVLVQFQRRSDVAVGLIWGRSVGPPIILQEPVTQSSE